jgi:nitroimidazol reductase NimA-like FMN-containing flavoprotein (pyridoxamine 5'-phosphate oxidase superfamily)
VVATAQLPDTANRLGLTTYAPLVDLTALTRLPEKASTDRSHLDSLLDDCIVGHVGFAVDGQPVVIPTAIARDGDRVLLHGSTGSGWMRHLAGGSTVSVAVTAVEGLVVARSAFESSMHYRSAVIFGTCDPLDGDSKAAALDVLTEHLLPGRVAEVRRPTSKELAATLVLALPIDTWSLKVSAGWPEDPLTDVDGQAWAGVVPLSTSYGEPLVAPDLRQGIPVPTSVRSLS